MRTKLVKRTATTLELNAQDVLELLRASGLELPARGLVSVRFRVPGGGDYSNMDVEVSTDAPIVVAFETVEHEEEGA